MRQSSIVQTESAYGNYAADAFTSHSLIATIASVLSKGTAWSGSIAQTLTFDSLKIARPHNAQGADLGWRAAPVVSHRSYPRVRHPDRPDPVGQCARLRAEGRHRRRVLLLQGHPLRQKPRRRAEIRGKCSFLLAFVLFFTLRS